MEAEVGGGFMFRTATTVMLVLFLCCELSQTLGDDKGDPFAADLRREATTDASFITAQAPEEDKGPVGVRGVTLTDVDFREKTLGDAILHLNERLQAATHDELAARSVELSNEPPRVLMDSELAMSSRTIAQCRDAVARYRRLSAIAVRGAVLRQYRSRYAPLLKSAKLYNVLSDLVLYYNCFSWDIADDRVVRVHAMPRVVLLAEYDGSRDSLVQWDNVPEIGFLGAAGYAVCARIGDTKRYVVVAHPAVHCEVFGYEGLRGPGPIPAEARGASSYCVMLPASEAATLGVAVVPLSRILRGCPDGIE